jgi:hypothetical protein
VAFERGLEVTEEVIKPEVSFIPQGSFSKFWRASLVIFED